MPLLQNGRSKSILTNREAPAPLAPGPGPPGLASGGGVAGLRCGAAASGIDDASGALMLAVADFGNSVNSDGHTRGGGRSTFWRCPLLPKGIGA